MATLVDEGLFKYLDNLKKEVDERRRDYASEGIPRFPDSLQSLVHSQMQKVIDAEKRFLKYSSSNSNTKAMLSISQITGLPSVDSLKPDLENMCELTKEKEPIFEKIAEEYTRGVEIKDKKKFKKAYKKVSKKEWYDKSVSQNHSNIDSKIGFDFGDSNDGNFEIILKESFHMKGNDKYCKEFPVLTREGRIKYCYVLNSLLSEFEEDHYILKDQAIQKFRKKDALANKVGPSKILGEVAKTYGFSACNSAFNTALSTCGFIRTTLATTSSMLIAPSAFRMERENTWKKYAGTSEAGYGLGGLGAFLGVVVTIFAAPAAIMEAGLLSTPALISTLPITTNVISGTYEIGRAVCRDTKKKWREAKQKLEEKYPKKALRDSND